MKLTHRQQRLRPERGAKSPRESEWGWGPTRIDKCGRCVSSHLGAVMFLLLAAVAGCRQDMHDQPKYRPLRASAFFDNSSSARPLVEGTVARGTLQTDAAFFTGKNGAMLVTRAAVRGDRRRSSIAARSATTSTARRATTAPAAATAWSCSAAFRSRRRITAIACGRRRPATSSTS